jgi:histidyl-tRNA synthetase
MSDFRPPRGTRDVFYDEAVIRRRTIEKLREHFLRFGFGDFDTPAIEHLETLEAKSGPEVADQIYCFDDKAGRRLGLIFEFTASLGRVVATNPDLVLPFKRYQIGKVWRYEAPQSNRYREFYQADIDIIGPDTMDCEVEILTVVAQVLRDFGIDDFRFILNNRKVLQAQLRVAGVTDDEAQATVLRGLDKFEKIGPEGVQDYVLRRGVDPQVYERLTGLLPDEGAGEAILDAIEGPLAGDDRGLEGVRELREILRLARQSDLGAQVQITPLLVRGLDYYTGPIFEVRSAALGNVSFGGGGRYDTLVEVFGGRPVGAVGFAFGVDRLVNILSQQGAAAPPKCEARVMVAARTQELAADAFKLANRLRAAGIPVFQYVGAAKLGKQLSFANQMAFPFVVVVAEDELAAGVAQVKAMDEREAANVALNEIADFLRERLG